MSHTHTHTHTCDTHDRAKGVTLCVTTRPYSYVRHDSCMQSINSKHNTSPSESCHTHTCVCVWHTQPSRGGETIRDGTPLFIRVTWLMHAVDQFKTQGDIREHSTEVTQWVTLSRTQQSQQYRTAAIPRLATLHSWQWQVYDWVMSHVEVSLVCMHESRHTCQDISRVTRSKTWHSTTIHLRWSLVIRKSSRDVSPV